jgi:hypothetical protein
MHAALSAPYLSDQRLSALDVLAYQQRLQVECTQSQHPQPQLLGQLHNPEEVVGVVLPAMNSKKPAVFHQQAPQHEDQALQHYRWCTAAAGPGTNRSCGSIMHPPNMIQVSLVRVSAMYMQVLHALGSCQSNTVLMTAMLQAGRALIDKTATSAVAKHA